MTSALRGIFACTITLILASAASATGMRTFEDHNGSVQIPDIPQRIVALNDHILAMPLVDRKRPVKPS